MREEIRLTGISSQLSDYDCKDGEAEAISGLWQDENGIKAAGMPDAQFSIDSNLTLVGVHETSLFRHYILKSQYTHGYTIYWVDDDVTGELTTDGLIDSGNYVNLYHSSDILRIAAIGNVLVLMTQGGLKYLLWKTDEDPADSYCSHLGAYNYLGDHLPELPVRFSLNGNVVTYPDDFNDAHTDFTTDGDGNISEENRLAYTNHIKGLLNKLIVDKGQNDGKFIFPFLVRYAYRLYDGSVTMHSAPVLMTPSTKMAPLLLRHLNDYGANDLYLCAAAVACELKYQVIGNTSVLDDWKDIVKSVDFFITPPIYTYDQGGENIDNLAGHSTNDEPGVWVGRGGMGYTTYEPRYYYQVIADSQPYGYPNWYWVYPPMKSDEKIAEEIRTAGDFYFVKSVNVDDLTDQLTSMDISSDYLQSLRQRERLEDDYGSHDTLIADYAYVYNNRVNFSGLTLKRFGGYFLNSALQYTNDSSTTAKAYWKISNQYGEKTVTSGEETYGETALVGGYLFYPSTDCTKAYVKYNGGFRELTMKTHEMLNGSVYFDGFDALMPQGTVAEPTASADLLEPIQDKIYTTEINNPFLFPISGINTIPGGGKILGLSSATKALSEGQFGQFPLYAFTTSGVWALQVSESAGYTTRQPIGRDVCLSGTITQTDDAVIFVSDRGIMVVSGSKIDCISDRIIHASVPVDGHPTTERTTMLDYLRGSGMVYDYVGQRLIVYNPLYDYSLVYSIKSGQWGGAMYGIDYHLPAWPSSLTVSDGKVRVIKEVNDDLVKGWIVTRPMKLRNHDILKTIRSLIVRGTFRQGHVAVELEGSRDLFRWYKVWSSNSHYVRGFSGTPWKYFRIRMWTLLDTDESISGVSIDYQPKYTNKLR